MFRYLFYTGVCRFDVIWTLTALVAQKGGARAVITINGLVIVLSAVKKLELVAQAVAVEVPVPHVVS